MNRLNIGWITEGKVKEKSLEDVPCCFVLTVLSLSIIGGIIGGINGGLNGGIDGGIDEEFDEGIVRGTDGGFDEGLIGGIDGGLNGLVWTLYRCQPSTSLII